MTKKLLVVAASGLVLAILLLSIAWAIGGKDMIAAIQHGGWHHHNWNYNVGDDDHDQTSTRSLPFDPAVPLIVDAPVDLHFVRGEHPGMTINGPARLVSAVRWENGRLSMSETSGWSHRSLNIDIVAPRLPPLTLAGAGDVSLKDLDQDELQLKLSGAGDFDVSGKVRTVTIANSGAGSVDLGKLNATDAAISLSGIGSVDLAATGKVNVSVSGAGSVTLHRKPAELTSQISGIGSVDQDY